MSYLVLARKYRPESFESVSGQEHVTRTLSNAIERDQVGHAYVFTGPRGVGKTSIARIFAKCLNCAEGPTVAPCGECQNCKEISAGNSLAVREIDGASNNSVDNVRELIESFRTLPAPGSKYKVYIIDEVHMLSLSAFNALLKSLEEPPPNTVFILATTEPHKIPDTVLSRCQRHDLRTLSMAAIGARIEQIAQEEQFDIESGAIKIIAKLAEGSMRDAQTLLERARAYSDGQISTKEVSTILGSVDVHLLYALAEKILEHDVPAALELLQSVFEQGADEVVFLREFVLFFRELHIASICSEAQSVQFGITEDEYRDLQQLAKKVEQHDLADIADMIREGADKALRSSFPQYAAESLIVRVATRPPVKDIGKMVGKLRDMVASSRTTQQSPQQKKKPPESLPKKSAPSAPVIARKEAQSIEHKPQEVPQPEPAKQSISQDEAPREFSLEPFVEFMNARGAVMVSELLRRVSVKRFESGVLDIEGPEFQIESILREDNKARLTELLSQYSDVPQWHIRTKVSAGNGSAAPDSIAGKQEAIVEKQLAERKKQMLKHDSVKQVLEVFPGSNIEKVRIKRHG